MSNISCSDGCMVHMRHSLPSSHLLHHILHHSIHNLPIVTNHNHFLLEEFISCKVSNDMKFASYALTLFSSILFLKPFFIKTNSESSVASLAVSKISTFRSLTNVSLYLLTSCILSVKIAINKFRSKSVPTIIAITCKN